MSDRPDRRDKAAMGRWIGVPAGDPAAGLVSTIVVKGESAMSEKASGDGFYTTTDEQGIVHHFVVQKGDTVPDGAEFTANESSDAPDAEQPAKADATVKAATGPTETTAAKAPEKTS